jgi:alpha-tubulin suppressor-like RCC1 family protein
MVLAVMSLLGGFALGAEIVTSWGQNENGQLGLGSKGSYDYFEPQRIPEGITVGTLSGVTQFACGGQHVLARMDDGTVRAWGYGLLGQLGQTVMDTDDKVYATPVPGLSDARAVAAGGNHSIAITSSNTLAVWGNNTSGQLGLGNKLPRFSVTHLSGVEQVDQVVCGPNFTLILLDDDTVLGCGNNMLGQLATEDTNAVTSPVAIDGLTNVYMLACGDSHGAAVLNGGQLKVWGYNGFGQLGLGDTTSRTAAVLHPDFSGVAEVACGGFHTLVRLNDGTIKAFGQNLLGQLGVGDHTNYWSPVTVSNLNSVSALAAGEQFSMALLADGHVKSWGCNLRGQLGQGEILTITNPVPAFLPRLANMAQVGCGNQFAMAMGVETPVLEVTPAMIDFGTVTLGHSEEDQFTVKNVGFGYLDVDASVDSPFSILSEPVPLYDNEPGLVRVQFTPPEPLSYSNTVTFSGGVGVEPLYRYVLGRGWAPHFYLKWSSVTGATYQVTLSSNLLHDVFDTLWRTNIAATPPSNELVWTNQFPDTNLFFRVVGDSNQVLTIEDFQYRAVP